MDALIADFTGRMADPSLASLFENCYPNSLDTTVQSFVPSTAITPPSAFVITGDIDAQWFRDSANQLLPYVPLTTKDPALADLICGLVLRHADDVAHDPFANAFNFNASGAGHQSDSRFPPMTPRVFEGKYELDSLAAVLKLAASYYNATGDKACFLARPSWAAAMATLVATVQSMQAATGAPADSPYRFQREASTPTETQMLDGMGPPAAYTGMSRSPFRPSDDATTFPYLIPAEAMAVVELRRLAVMLGAFLDDLDDDDAARMESDHLRQLEQLAFDAATVAKQIDEGIQKFGIAPHPTAGRIFAYEVDGFGSVNFMDDANCPSLLSLPYLGYVQSSDPVYLATRSFVWSHRQGFWWSGSGGRGIGGPHAGYGMIWPMSMVMFALTSESDAEISWALDAIKQSSAGTGLLHESFWINDVNQFTRPWFAWVNGLFGELVIKIAAERPHLIFKQ